MVFDVKAAHASEPDKSFKITAQSKSEAARIVREKGYFPFSVSEVNEQSDLIGANQTGHLSGADAELSQHFEPVLAQINRVIAGKELQVKLAVACLLSGGHLLIDDIPGVGKTTFSHALANSFGLDYKRVQFTSDLLPSDILGVSIFDPSKAGFNFHKGAIFSQVLLADEINRASSKTQSALLEAMEERQVTVDGESHDLPNPFFIIATQNPQEHLGTNPLPESQIDRFAVRLVLGYPEIDIERNLWKGENGRTRIDELQALISPEQLLQLQTDVGEVFISDALLDYLAAIVQYTRNGGRYIHGLSPRAALILLQVTRAWALLHGRDYAIPLDMQAVLPYVAAHRLQPLDASRSVAQVYTELLEIAIP